MSIAVLKSTSSHSSYIQALVPFLNSLTTCKVNYQMQATNVTNNLLQRSSYL
uniref:Uncharacterized protein n=1 Tax=Arion vulgaris TaxID=1028688 RepID=A0A0B6ZK29_9EUPU